MPSLETLHYLDNASTTPVRKEVLEAMLPYFSEHFGNPSSQHVQGAHAKEALENSRQSIAKAVGVDADELIFTSGSTESINHILKGLFFEHSHSRNQIITVKTEHKAVLETCKWLEGIGARVTYLDVDENGLLVKEQLEEELSGQTLAVAVMHVNNETGVIHKLAEYAALAQDVGAYFFSDCTQSIGKIPVDLSLIGVHAACFNAHKLGGPKGIGVSYIKKGIAIQPFIHGGAQEDGRRGGTHNVAGAVGLAKALELALEDQESHLQEMQQMQDRIEKAVAEKAWSVNACAAARSPYVYSINTGEDTGSFLKRNKHLFSASTGSACNAEIVESSHVLRAMNDQIANSTVRFSVRSLQDQHELLRHVKLSP